jgi:hypothetical protein
MLLALGCSPPKKTDANDPFMDRVEGQGPGIEGICGSSPKPPELVKETPVRPVEASSKRKDGIARKRVSLKMSNVDVSVLLRALAGADVSIILNDRVTAGQHQHHPGPWDQVFIGIPRPQPDLRLAGRHHPHHDGRRPGGELRKEAGARICSWPKRRLPHCTGQVRRGQQASGKHEGVSHR